MSTPEGPYYKMLGLGLGVGLLFGGQFLYSLRSRSSKMQNKKDVLTTERKRLVDKERQQYEKRI